MCNNKLNKVGSLIEEKSIQLKGMSSEKLEIICKSEDNGLLERIMAKTILNNRKKSGEYYGISQQ